MATQGTTAKSGKGRTASRVGAVRRRLQRLWRDRRGSMMVLGALVMPAILGFSAMGVDATLWYLQRRELQSIADAAAVAATIAAANDMDADAYAAAQTDAARNDFALGSKGRQLTVNSPPASGAYAGESGYVEVIVQQQADLYFVSSFVDGPVNIAARAVGGAVDVGEHCIIGLDHSLDKTVEFTGTADVYVECGVASNSSSNQSIYLGGTAELTADPAQAYGDIYIHGNATLTTQHPLQSLSQRVADPYGDLSVPTSVSSMSCTANRMNARGTVTLSPGKYCNGLGVTNGTVTFQPGTYYIDGGDFDVKGTSTLTGNGVTFVLTGDTSAKVGTLKVAGGTVANLSAATSGDYAGVLIYQDGKATALNSNTVLGGSSMEMKGALYFPNGDIKFSGGSGSQPACLQIIARKVTFQGNGYVSNDATNCENLNVKKIAQIRVRLVE